MDTPELLAKIEALSSTRKVKLWKGEHAQRIYVTFPQPKGHSAPQVVLDATTRKAHTVAWPSRTSYNREHGESLDRLISWVDEWYPAPEQVQEAPNAG